MRYPMLLRKIILPFAHLLAAAVPVLLVNRDFWADV